MGDNGQGFTPQGEEMVFRIRPQQHRQDVHSSSLLSDYHLHSHFSPDAHYPIDQLCRQALELGLRSIAATDHIEWRLPGFGNPRPEAYFEELYQARDRYRPLGLTVMSGLEVGNPHDYPRKFSSLLSLFPFDVVVASLHWLGEENIHHTSVFQGEQPQRIYRRYFQELGALIRISDFDVLAHPDRIFWAGVQCGAPPDLVDLEPLIREAWAALAAEGKILELNTKYINRLIGWNELVRRLYRWYQEEGGVKVVINSDAHTPGEIGREFSTARNILAAVGLEEIISLSPAVQGAVFP